jgi:pyruvate,water dikinase
MNGDILVTTSTDPGWVTLFPSASGIIVERGSLLSHSAIVSREMGIPCIVSVTGLLKTLKTGDEIEMDGSTGVIKLIKKV